MAEARSGWTMWSVLVWRVTLVIVTTMVGGQRTVIMGRMQEWCVKVGVVVGVVIIVWVWHR